VREERRKEDKKLGEGGIRSRKNLSVQPLPEGDKYGSKKRSVFTEGLRELTVMW
jgi:hypothetical protein